MRLKRLELLGFKSFADRTVFEFGDDTLTGVVGPNGCGKSNVVDAMRWILGEQRPTSMRGKEMTDVIFKGCASRPAMGFAEGTIVLDNSMGTIEGQGAEIAVTRRVFASGEGEYQLDGQKVRLKDIKEMLFDTGLGSRGYSVLEQGRIDAVLSANPIDRRRIFEEAAGISRYRQRKHETELRLARVEQDLARLEDVTGELRSRVRSLKIQAGKAERYRETRGEWETHKTRLVKHQLHALGGALTSCVERLSVVEAELGELRGERETSEVELARLEARRDELQAGVEETAREAARLEGDARALDERRRQLLARVQSWETAAKDEEQRAQDLCGLLEERARELDVLAEQRTALEREVTAAREASERQVGARRDLDRAYADARRLAQEQNQKVLGLLHEKTAAQNTQRHLEESRGPAEQRFLRVEERLGEARGQLEGVRVEAEEAQGEVARHEQAQAAAQAELAGLEGELRVAESELAAAEGERRELALEIARRTSRIESLLDRERELADLGDGARAVLASAASGDGPCEAAALKGLLADHLSTSTEHARALDAVLGERAAALVTEDLEAAHRVARWLSGEEKGQAALAVAGGLGLPRATARPALAPELAVRVRGELRAFVRCDEGYAALASSLLADVWLVDDLDAALAVVAALPGGRCVTPAGELVDAAGLVAGARTLAQGAIGRRSSAAELEQGVRELEDRSAELDARVAQLTVRRAALRARFERAGEVLGERKDELAKANGRLRTAEARLRDLGAALALLERECAGVLAEREKLAQDLVAAERRVRTSQDAFARENSELQALEHRRHALEEQRETCSRDESRAHVERTRLEEQLGGLRRRIEDLSRARSENETEAQRAERLSREAAESAQLGAAESRELAQSCERVTVEREGVDGRLAELRAEVAVVIAELEELRRGRDALTRTLEGRAGDLSDLRLEEQRIGLARADVVRRTEEELGVEPDDLLEGFEPELELCETSALTALEAQVKELKNQLDRLGPVNLEALGELEEVGGRLEFLEQQIHDLVQSRKVLNDTLKKIEEESERLFVKTFDEVRVNFQRIFRQLFGGGKADVKLAEDQPVLEAGVEISARPPGREMLPIGLLSGGQRTMTALALLFAVFEARPSPFCVLDEVDAALDDANIQRFLGMLNLFRQHTQFVVVTHNKGTMAAADSLYGVTMQTKGVSRQVSVQLDEVDEFVPEATGKSEAQGEGPADNVSLAFGENVSIEDPGPDPELDEESGEPVVELVPTAAGLPEEAPVIADADLAVELVAEAAPEPEEVDSLELLPEPEEVSAREE